jgi:hypothetical protein
MKPAKFETITPDAWRRSITAARIRRARPNSITVAVLLMLAALPASAYCPDRLLAAISARETPGGWDGRSGPAGEVSQWQITPAVWRQHMGAQPLRDAWNVQDARICAERHLAWLDAGLRRHGYEPTPERLALAWNLGLSGALQRGCRPHAYARQVGNIYLNGEIRDAG